MNNYLSIPTVTIIFIMLSLIALIVILVMYFFNLKHFRQSLGLLNRVQRSMGDIARQMQEIRRQMEILSKNLQDSTADTDHQVSIDAEDISAPAEIDEAFIPQSGQAANHVAKKAPKKSLAEIIDNHLEMSGRNHEQVGDKADAFRAPPATIPAIQDEILKFLTGTDQATHFQDILRHLSEVLSAVDADTFMIALDELESIGKVEAELVGGKLHYKLK